MNNELKVLEGTAHPNIVRVYELLHDENFYYIVSEYLKHGELYKYVCNKSSLQESEVQKIIK